MMYLCRQMTDASLQSIGDLLGGRDHSTVNHGVDKIARDVKKDETLKYDRDHSEENQPAVEKFSMICQGRKELSTDLSKT